MAEETGPIAALQIMWKALPAPDAMKPDALPAECETMRDFVVALRTKLVPDVKNLSSPPVHNGSQCFVLWKNRQFVANRMKYRGGARELKDSGLPAESAAAKAMTVPGQFVPAVPVEYVVREPPRFHQTAATHRWRIGWHDENGASAGLSREAGRGA